METKFCSKCQQIKEVSEFYPSKRDGYQSRCKDCNREAMKLYNRTPERREHNRQLHQKLKDKGYFKEYEQKPKVKKHRAAQQREYSRNPRLRIRYLARWYAKRMLREGKIQKQPCAQCGDKAEMHHPDYNKPLLIVWLCSKCHKALTRQLIAKGE